MPRQRKAKKTPKKTGRPSVYNADEHPKAARQLVGNGKTMSDIAESFGVERHTVAEWVNRHPEFAAAIDLGRSDATAAVERALFQRATGYSHPAVKILAVSGGQGMGSSIEEVPYTEHYPPDTEAAKFWLKNRSPKEWRDKQEITGQDGGPIRITVETGVVADLERKDETTTP